MEGILGANSEFNSKCIMPSWGKRVLTRGVARAIMNIVVGMRKREVYFTEEEKTVFTNSGSFCGFSFEKVGNRAVDMGKLIKVTSTEKHVAA